jgi:osmotically-inducible protein OsmY
MQSVGYPLTGIFFGMVLLPPLAAVEPARSRAEPLPSTVTDCRLTLFARQALQQDHALAFLNLGVSVHANVATLWGPIPSAELSRRAEEVVRQVPGIVAVRNELQIDAAKVTVQNLFGLPVPSSPREPVRGQPPLPAGSLAKRPFEAKPNIAVPTTPPIVISLRPPLPPDPPPAVVVPVSAQVTPPLETAVERVRSADARFRQVRLEIKDGIVHLRGMVPRGEDMYELAQQIAKVPGVKRVIVEEVQTPPPRRLLSLP